MNCPKCGSERTKKNGSDKGRPRIKCHDCGSFSTVSDTFVVPDGYAVKGTSTLYDADGNVRAQWVKTREDADRQRLMFEAMVEAVTADLPRYKPVKCTAHWRADLMTVYPMGDPHFGMLSWGRETGEDWDLEIAERIHCSAVSALVEASPASEQAVVVNLGDGFHYDSLAAVTPRSGHHLDADGRYAKMIEIGTRAMRRCIDSALTKHGRVHVICVPGNHDETGALWLSRLLATCYEREPRVTVDTNPSLYAFHRFGRVLLGVHHGHACKPQNLPGVMAVDRAEDWGQTLHRHWLTGHIHHESKKEYAGCTVESFGTLAAKDAWAHSSGYRSERSMQSIVYHAEHGEVGRGKVNARMFEEA